MRPSRGRVALRPVYDWTSEAICTKTCPAARRHSRRRRLRGMPDEIKILVADDMSNAAVEIMSKAGLKVDVNTGLAPAQLAEIIGAYHGLAVRSATKVT